MIQAVLISLVPLAAAAINNLVIPIYEIFPFQPFCSVLVALLAYFFMAAREADALQTQNEKAIQDALDKANEATARAEEASKVKTTFLSNMSHDIRTPMNAIINLTQLAMHEDDITVVRDYLDKISVSGNFLLGLINDILDMTKIESGEIEFHKENLTRTEFINTVETVILPLMEARHIHFHGELNPGEYTIFVDKLRFNQIFFNLLSNAAKFTPEGGDVWFEVTNLEAENGKLNIKFVVRDNGIGMSKEFLNHLFEPFAREQSALSGKTQGTGLGLPIVKNLVEAMGGTISVKSELGKGTEFVVMIQVDIVAKNELTQHDPALEAAPDLQGMHVLLVEDNELNTYVARIILENAGCQVTTAENGKVALDTFSASEPGYFEAILMDVRMPVMDGIQATIAIRGLCRSDAGTVPIIAMTADAFDDERKRTLESGMNYHLAKPVDAQQLYSVLARCRKTK
jgi:signal transduction histidine kinase/CheY-like chemotaxis protein